MGIFISADGYKAYYDGQEKRHREDGPAFIYGRTKEYWVKGVLHRTDGPAVFRAEKKGISMPEVIEYWIEGIQLTKKEFEKKYG